MLLGDTRSLFVVHYERHFSENHQAYLVMEYCENGDLAAFLPRLKQEGQNLFGMGLFYRWASQAINGVRYLHVDRNIVHRDIKSG